MPKIQWGDPLQKTYQSGLDRGVVYFPDGQSAPWNGLVSVVTNQNQTIESVFYEGVKAHDIMTLGSFSGGITALTYPNEFDMVQGQSEILAGVHAYEQPSVRFNMSYRTKVGNQAQGSDAAYKIHLLYNVAAYPLDMEEMSINDSPETTIFEWEISAVPEPIKNHRPSSHIVLDSRKVDPYLLGKLEELLYGTDTTYPSLPPLIELTRYIESWYRVNVDDNGDGTYTVWEKEYVSGYILEDTPEVGMFTLISANVEWISEDRFFLRDSSRPLPGE